MKRPLTWAVALAMVGGCAGAPVPVFRAVRASVTTEVRYLVADSGYVCAIAVEERIRVGSLYPCRWQRVRAAPSTLTEGGPP